MALIQTTFMSYCLGKQTSVTVVLPISLTAGLKCGRKEKFQTLYLLHGMSDDNSNWLRYTTIEKMAEENKIAVVMPNADLSFYTDMAYGSNYYSYISNELPNVMRAMFPLSDKKEDNFIAGLSMGGYGAFKIAMKNPDNYEAAASLSGVLNVARFANVKAVTDVNIDDKTKQYLDMQGISVEDYKSMVIKQQELNVKLFKGIFGDVQSLDGSCEDIFYLAKKIKDEGKCLKLFAACGTEDFLYSDNIKFKNYAAQIGLRLKFEEGPGTHEWGFWQRYIERAMKWMPLKRTAL